MKDDRLFDLVRFARHFLHDAELISDDEYTELLTGGGDPPNGSVKRLESYDELCKNLDNVKAERDTLQLALAETAIPLEVLNLHMRADSISLCDEMKQGITKAVESIRRALLAPARASRRSQ